VGRYVTLHALLAGFFGFGAVQYFAQWCWSRGERVLLLFAAHCLLGAALSLALLALGQATTIAEAQLALGVRTTISLVWVAASVTLAARITGFAPRAFTRPLVAVLLLSAAVSFVLPLNGAVTDLHISQAWWGGTFTMVRREPSPWLGAVYVAVAVAFGYGVVAAAHMWRRDHVGAALAAAAAGGGLVASLIDDTILGGLGGLLILNSGTVVLSIVIAAGLSVAAGVIPALGLSRRPIVELLRVTG